MVHFFLHYRNCKLETYSFTLQHSFIKASDKNILVGGQIGRETPGLVPIPEVKPPGGVESTAPHGAGNSRRRQPNLFFTKDLTSKET